MSLDIELDDWDALNVQGLDSSMDDSSFQLVTDEPVASADDLGAASDVPLPAPNQTVRGPRFSSPFQLDPNHVAVSQVHHHCTFESGLPRPELLQRSGPTRITELPSGGKPLPKRQSRRPDSIRSVHEQSSSHPGLCHTPVSATIMVPCSTSKRLRVRSSAEIILSNQDG